MGFLGTMYNALGNGVSAFRETILNADPQLGRAGIGFDPGSWDRWEARQVRYDLYWGLYQNNAYRDLVHAWSARYKTAFGAYKHVRHLYNPAYRLGEFWAGHLMGGALDRAAGDGDEVPSALPILTDFEGLRPPIAALWKASRWQVHKEVFTRWGSVLGDVALKVCDDPARAECRLEVVHPGHLKWVDRDESGAVVSYIIQRWAYDPRDADISDISPTVDPQARRKRVTYYEKCYRDGRAVTFETYLNGELYPWNGVAAKWDEPYGFVPLVVTGHEAIGLDWSQNCFHAGLSRFLEVDDQASCTGDQNRRALKNPVLIAGAKGPSDLASGGVDRASRTPQQNLNNPEPARSENPILYSSSAETSVHSLLGNLDVAAVCGHITDLLSDIEKNYPELLADTGNLGGTVTAEAIRNARQRAAAKVQARRAGYDEALVRAHRMALAIGGLGGYPGYEGLAPGGLDDPSLDHAIGHRGVFEVDPVDRLEEDALLWANACKARTAGVPLSVFLARNGWSDADLAALEAAVAAQPQPPAAITLGQPAAAPPDAGADI